MCFAGRWRTALAFLSKTLCSAADSRDPAGHRAPRERQRARDKEEEREVEERGNRGQKRREGAVGKNRE